MINFDAFGDELIKLAVGRPSMPPPTMSSPSQHSARMSGLIEKYRASQKAKGLITGGLAIRDAKTGENAKVAQQMVPDPRSVEMEERKQNPPPHKYMNKEVLKQLGKNTLAIGGGMAVGEGAALLTNMGLEAASKRMGHKLHPAVPYATRVVLVPAMGVGAAMAYRRMRRKHDELLEDARQRGEAQQGGPDVTLDDFERINPQYGGSS